MSNENLPPSAFYGNIPTIPDHIPQAGKKVVSKMESTTGGWISADEPPKEHGRYWCFVEYISDLGRSSYQWNCSWNQCEGRWGDLAEEGGIVTHWQPLPKPPEVSDD